VLCDRFTDATFAYQGAGRGFDLDVLRTLEGWAQDGQDPRADALLEPDLTLWFDLEPEVAAERLAGARLPDKFESQPVEFFRRVRAGYAQRAEGDPRFERIGSDRPKDEVRQRVAEAIRRRGLTG
jgi:dTMP kinase